MPDHLPLPSPEEPVTVSVRSRPPETNAQPPTDDAAPEAPPDKPNRRKWGKVPNEKWEEHRDTLYNLYIVEGLTMEKTMAFMEKHHDLQASKGTYKVRFRSWGMTKMLKKGDINKDVARQQEELHSNENEILASDNRDSGTRVQRYLTKNGQSIPERTNSTMRASNANVADLPLVMRTTTEKATVENVPRVIFTGANAKVPFDVQVLCANGKALSLDELSMVQTEAVRQISQGQLDRGILMLRTAVARRKDMYKPTHPTIVATLWQLADAYGLNRQTQRAWEVIDCISIAYSHDLGLWHPQTLDHYQRVISNFWTSGRSNAARSMGFHLFAAIRDNLPPTNIISVPKAVIPDHAFSGITDSPEFQRIFSEHLDVDQMDRQLQLASIWSLIRVPGMELVLQKLISDFKLLPLDLRSRELKARCIYIYSLIDSKAIRAAVPECLTARHTLTSLVAHADPLHLPELIPIAQDLQCMYHSIGDTSGSIGRWIGNLIQDEMLKPFREIYGQRRDLKLIGHFISIGLGFQRRFKQKEALFWFDFASKVSVNVLGSDHSTSQRLGRAIRDQYFDDSEMPFEGF